MLHTHTQLVRQHNLTPSPPRGPFPKKITTKEPKFRSLFRCLLWSTAIEKDLVLQDLHFVDVVFQIIIYWLR